MDIAFLLFPGVTQLDLTGPAQVLSRLPDARVHLVWESLDPVPTDAGFSILPNATFADIPTPDPVSYTHLRAHETG
jgi:cyclohexyl-isocyanide hydratase